MEAIGRIEKKKLSNVGSYYFKHESEEEVETHDSDSEEETSVQVKKDQPAQPISNLLQNSDKPYKKVLNYSQEDIHALATQAELLVLKTSAHNDESELSEEEENVRDMSSEELERRVEGSESVQKYTEYPSLQLTLKKPENDAEKVVDDISDNPSMQQQEENSLQLSGTWDHDLQEQYLSEGSTLGSWDNSMKSVLCFGEDYSNYIRRKSELPSLENISIGVCGLEGSPRHQKTEEIDPIILLRMSERDWINTIHELNEKKETNFGDRENFERLITTCNVNLDILKSLKITEETNGPKCLPRDHKDLIDTWELLLSNLTGQLNQCISYSSINQEIEQLTNVLDNLTESADKETETGELYRQMEKLQCILSQLESIRPIMSTTSTSVHHLLSSVSSTSPEDVQKISLVCFCKQELTLLSERWDNSHSEATERLTNCELFLMQRKALEKEMADLKLWVGRERWKRRTFMKPSVNILFDMEKVAELKHQLHSLHVNKAISKSYFEQTLKYLDIAEEQLTLGAGSMPCIKGRGDSYLPLLVVTSVIVFYSYCYPVNWWDKACKLYHLVGW